MCFVDSGKAQGFERRQARSQHKWIIPYGSAGISRRDPDHRRGSHEGSACHHHDHQHRNHGHLLPLLATANVPTLCIQIHPIRSMEEMIWQGYGDARPPKGGKGGTGLLSRGRSWRQRKFLCRPRKRWPWKPGAGSVKEPCICIPSIKVTLESAGAAVRSAGAPAPADPIHLQSQSGCVRKPSCE